MIDGPIAQLVEHRADNAGVSGSSPLGPNGAVAQLGERLLCKQEVTGSSPVSSMKESKKDIILNFCNKFLFFENDLEVTKV